MAAMIAAAMGARLEHQASAAQRAPQAVAALQFSRSTALHDLSPFIAFAELNQMSSRLSVHVRYVRIRLQYRSQCLFKWREPRLVAAPLVHPIAEDRRAHLLGARRAHRALVLVEAQTGRLEG